MNNNSTLFLHVFLQPIRTNEEGKPERLNFRDKWKHFEAQIDNQAHSTPKPGKCENMYFSGNGTVSL